VTAYQFTDLGNEILVVEGLLEPALCSHLIEVTALCEFEQAGIELTQRDATIRNNALLYLGKREPLLQSTDNLLLGKVEVIQKMLYQRYGIGFPHTESCSILRYQAGQFYKRHIDNLLLPSRLDEAEQGVPTRDVSIVGYLNEGFEGGETYFDRQDIKVKPQQGSVLVFPSYWTHPHQSLPIRNGVKYAFTTWLFH